MRVRAERGFTLLEVLVALSIFSLAVMALLNVQGENARTASFVSTQVVAAVVAENRAVEVALGAAPLAAGSTEGTETQGGRVWRWTRRVSATSERSLVRVDITVRPDGSRRDAATLTLFRSVA